MKSEYISDYSPIPCQRADKYILKEHIVKQTTIECILAHSDKKIIALNFANAIVAGGAYLLGGNAQEESLCRASMLYYAIKPVTEFYSANRRHITADYTDGMIFSENVPVIRNDRGEMLSSPVSCDFITCPAVNRYEAFFLSKNAANSIMERRIEKIVSFAAQKHPRLIILGAFGCGAFGNKREDVLPMFERAINAYTDSSSEIIFAIP